MVLQLLVKEMLAELVNMSMAHGRLEAEVAEQARLAFLLSHRLLYQTVAMD